MRIIFAGGGTVGHISPSIAIAEELLKSDPNAEILFIGRDGGEENETVIRAGFSLKTVRVSGIQRKLTLENIKNVFLTLKALRDAKMILKDFSPDLVFGTGGYVSYPILKAAKIMNVKTAIHESNAAVGLASKALLRGCDLFFKGFDADIALPAGTKCVVSGNPVREEFIKNTRESARKKLGIGRGEILITSFGGSGGSRALNDAMLSLMKSYSMRNASIRHIHASGRKYYKDIARNDPILINGRNGCIVKPYLNNVADLLSASDIAITRCGAITLAELSACGTPAILIPSPNVTNDHQRKNADFFCKSGAALMINEKDLTADNLKEEVKKLVESKRLRREMSESILKLSKKDSREIIASEIRKLISS